ncbi:MAG: hypothetical protein C4586_08645 [Anaerolineaceae bacterium]|nr:MAG: hypothetical protein C4586_08645 [Anaerolineaceae bacterium]
MLKLEFNKPSINCMYFREKLSGVGENVCIHKFDTCTPVDCEDKAPYPAAEDIRQENWKRNYEECPSMDCELCEDREICEGSEV